MQNCYKQAQRVKMLFLKSAQYCGRHSMDATLYFFRDASASLIVSCIGGELYESVGVEAPILLSYTHKNEWNTHDGPPTRCQRSVMGVSLIFVGVRQQNGCFDTHTFIQFSTYGQLSTPMLAKKRH